MTTYGGLISGSVQALGGPTTIIELGPFRLITDPTFDPPGAYPLGGRVLTKLLPTAVSADDVGHIDAVLLSHDQHPDNLDHAGRAYLERAPLIFTTPTAATRLGMAAKGLSSWQQAQITHPAANPLTITAVPAQHGPKGTEHLTGPVTGFVLNAPGLPRVYISGDNASLDLVAEIADRVGEVDIAVLYAGAARTALLGDANLTPDSRSAAQAARLLGAPVVVPVHFAGWDHYTEGADTLRSAFAEARLDGQFFLLEPGERVVAHNGHTLIDPPCNAPACICRPQRLGDERSGHVRAIDLRP
jgi:L-ascorbate metabolism protein UlaG (beta-lactamase superfamily)